jgi:biotin transport system substrate-specific component
MSITRGEVSVWARLGPLARPRARQAVGIATFALLTALAAKIALPMPGTSVPFTFQPLAVLLAGALLGARAGAGSQLLYLSVGLAGLPVFFGPVAGPAYLFGPTGGYLLAFPVAAFVVGALAGRRPIRTALALLAGLAVIYAGGVAWLSVLGGFSSAVMLGLFPFIVADLVKAAMALVIATRLRSRSLSLFGA